MKFYYSILFLLVLSVLQLSCAQGTGIFPLVDLSTTEGEVVFPNPISLAVDETNSQIVLINSNVDILYDQGSIAVLSVDATDTAAPVLTTQQVVAVPNFAGEAFFDGAGSLYVPFREFSLSDETVDILKKYTLSASSIAEALSGTVSADPYGIVGNAGSLYVVSDDVLGVYDTGLVNQVNIDLTTALTAGIDDTDAANVLSVAIDATLNLAVVSNAGGRMFIVDLATNAIRQAVDGPQSTREALIDPEGILYVLDALTETVWVFDLNLLPAVTAAPESVDDSAFLLTAIGVGSTPYGMALDSAGERLYVSNFAEDSVSVIDTVSYQEIDRVSLDADDLSASFARGCDGPISLESGVFNSVRFLFAACFLSHDVVVINTETLRVVEVYPNTAL